LPTLPTPPPKRLAPCNKLALGLWLVLIVGCGTTQQRLATEQLLESDAVDAAISQVDFSPLAGESVYFDTTYLQDYKGVGFVNSNYVISGLRQQILAAGCKLEDSKETASIVIEGRVGALGSDRHDMVYGIPQNNALASASSVVPGATALPAIPELSVARKAASYGAAKVALFAYDRESRERVWQSGLSMSRSTSKDTWILGAGPFQYGTIHRDRVRFAGNGINLRFWRKREVPQRSDAEFLAYERSTLFEQPRHTDPAAESLDLVELPAEKTAPEAPEIQLAVHEEPAAENTPSGQQSESTGSASAPPSDSVATVSPSDAETSPVSEEPMNDATDAEQEPLPFPPSADSLAQPIPTGTGSASTGCR
jgi:hypothetical protein